MEEPADSGGGSVAQGPTTLGPTAQGPTTQGPTAQGPTTQDPTAQGPTTHGPTARVAEIRCRITARPMRLLEWKVKPGSLVNVDSVLALCVPINPEKESEQTTRQPEQTTRQPEQTTRQPEQKLKSDRAGVVRELCCQVGQVISPGGVIVRVEECSHPVVMKGLCAECGQDLTQMQSNNGRQQAHISMVHSVPELMVSSEQAEQLGREDQQRLHRNKKLVLMVDLDQTLIHTTEQHCPRMSNKGIFHFQLGRGEPMLHTRLRPHCKEFLEKIAKLYELHVFTFGSRLYAHTIAGFLDPEKKLFSHRILSRDECIDPFSKTGNLRNLFPCGDSMVCIIDDREDVWKFAPNLITVKKYNYFQGTGDINAPPGSRDAQQGRKAGIHGTRLAQSSEPAGTSGTTESTAGGSGGASEEQSNGLRKPRGKDHHEGCKKESTAQSATPVAANERTQPDGGEAREESRGQGEGAEASTSAQVSDRTDVKEEVQVEAEDGSRTVGSGEKAPPPDFQESNSNLDFDLSSDSDSGSITGKLPSSDSEGEGGSSQTRKCKPDRAEPSGLEESSLKDGENSKECKEKSAGENGAEVGEGSSGQSVVLPADPENGCSERREAETESQNSEQSGVTMGEESLDQSMEEEEEEVDIDKDDHLIYLEEVLERIHREYYARYEAFLRKERPATPDIRKIVPELKGRTLVGTTIVFSGLYPTNYPMERTRESYHAKALGAKIGKALMLRAKDPGRTTHLIAARTGTEKVRQAQGYKHLHVVNPEWLWGCLERWERVEESLYPLKEDYIKTQRNSPAAFPDLQSSLQMPLYPHGPDQRNPVQAAPKSRTYDPVTGKLIRRGPQASKPPSYMQASMSASHGDQASLRGGQRAQQGETAGPSSQDDDQPGPSCRRRERQPSMSETNPLYTLCKEDLDSMDKEVDDILDEESDEEGEGRVKKTREMEEEEEMDEEEEGQRPQGRGQSNEDEMHHLPPQDLATVKEITEKTQTPSSDQVEKMSGGVPRGQKRKLAEAKVEEVEEEEGESADESTKDSNEEEEGSSSEADEMAAALDAELNDFM
ncbi:hypothetical protein DPEC_G00283160 [Dallia pectoralis]|uniref:Uncharacterized protein n=1 Tax=Dallia pectoralis TaxID=75939 RepID=A0ACC2FJ48_DALPE|nr:hypothetical protein DPEC_G00283160 [Dallia pectoralis]